MDDGGQRLLDVIEDTHVLETFLRENFSNSGLEDSSRYDNVSSNAESGLVSSGGLDSFVFDGQLVDPLRGGPAHSSHHTHQVSPHVLQQVLHPSSLSAASSLSGASHQLHPHQIHHHHQSHHLQQSSLLQQHHSQPHLQHSQHQPNHPALSSPVGGTLDVDCIGRNRDSCSANRNDSDHTLQQLLASASPLGSSQQILQLHHQTHQHSLHQTHSQLQQLASQSHQHLQQQQLQSHHNQSLLPPSLQSPVLNSNSLQHQHHIEQSHRQQTQRQPHRHHSSQSHKLQHQQLPHSQESQASDVSNSLLSVGLHPVTSSSNSCNSLSIQQSPPIPVTLQDASRSSSKTSQSNQISTTTSNVSTKIVVPGTSSQTSIQSGSHGITSRVQVLGGHSQVLSSAAQQLLATPTSQLFPGTQIVQPSIPTQVISGGSILAGGQVFSAPNVLPGAQVLSSMPSGQVFPGGQLSNAQVLTNHLLSSSHVITTVGTISTTAAPLYVTPSIASQIHQPLPPLPPPVIHSSVGALHQNAVISSSLTPLSSPSTVSSFTVPSKSPVSSLPRTSPSPSYPATPSPHHTTPSPASYPSKSPAPSPHSNASTLKSPAPPPSPVVTPSAVTSTSQSTQTVVNSSSAQHGSTIVSGIVGNMGMVQGLVPHLPITKVGGTNGVVLAQGTNSVQVTPTIKQVVPGGQLIQIVSSQNNTTRQTVTIPHPKPIQPKQPQLLPKPSPQGSVRQPTPPPAGKTLIGARPTPPCNQHPIVLGTGSQQPTVITGQQNLGSYLLNSSLLQAGLQQPILIPQPNGVQLLVRPAGHHTGAAGQTLLVPMQSQSQVVTSVGKVPQPQTLVIPGNGQTPALVIPQGLTSALTGANMLNTSQNNRATQPILRLLAPQTPFQFIQTASGPMLVAVPVGQTALNLPGVFTTTTNPVRTISPQVAPGTLQIGSSLTPVSLNQMQLPSANIQVSNSNQHLQLSASLPTPLSSVITTTTTTTMATRPPEESISLSTTPSMQTSNQTSHAPVEVKHNSKKKSKKKKKEKDSKDDKGKGKGVSINLNELLKESGIFDENEFGGLGIEETDPALAVTQGIVQPQPPTTNILANTVNCKVSTGPNQLILSTPASQTINTISPNQNITSTIIATSCNTNTLGQNTIPITTIPTSVCFTFDVHGKLVLGSSDVGRPHITAIAGSFPTQVVSPGGMGLNLNPGGTFVIGSEGSIPVSKNSVTGISSMGHVVALHPSNVSHLGDVAHPSSVMKIDNMHPQLITSKAASSQTQTQNEIFRVAQNTQMIQSLEKFTNPGAPSLLTSLLSNPVPPIIGVPAGSEANISVNLTGSDKVSVFNADGKTLTDFSSNGIIGTHPSQLPINPAVIVSSYANSFIPGAILGGKTTTVASPSFNLVTTTNSIVSSKSTSALPVSVNIIDANKNLYNSQYSTSINSNIVEPKVKKSSKKKKKDKEADVSQVSYIMPGPTYQEKSKSSSLNFPPTSNYLTSIIQNGNVSPGNSVGISKTEGTSVKSDSSAPSIINSQSLPQTSPLYSISNFSISTISNTAVTSNSVISTSNSKSATHTVASSLSSPNESCRTSMPLIGTHSNLGTTSGFIVQPGQQVKQLFISPQNQEALKRVHNQIQDIQNKKGPLGEQDKALQQKLISEYKKIMATGTPVPMSHSSLSQIPHSVHSITTSSHNPIKYSHSVGHKKIFLTPNQKKGYTQSHPQSKKHFSEMVSKANEVKSKDSDSAATGITSTNTFSSHSILSTGGFTVSVAPTVTQTSPTSSSISFSSGQENLCSKSSEIDNVGQAISVTSSAADVATNTCSRNMSPSMPVIITSTKASVYSTPASSTPLSNSHTIGIQSSPIPQFSPIPPPVPSPVHSSQSSSAQVLIPSSVSGSPQITPSINPSVGVTFSQQHSTTISTPSVSPMRTSFRDPPTREQLFELQLRTDQNGALNPDYRTPFKSKTDACKRLIRYHVYNDLGGATSYSLMESDHQFEIQSEALIKKFSAMQYKYQSLLLKDSFRRHPSSETAMLYRLFVQEERNNLEREKIEVANGRELDLPPPPSHWVSGVPPPVDPPFPWEEEWPNQKEYFLTREVEPFDEISEGDTPFPLPVCSNSCEDEERRIFVSHSENDEGISSRINHWEEDFEEEGQDEGRLQILMEEETDESKSQEDADPVDEGGESLPSDSGGYFSRSPGIQDDSEPLDERTSRNRHYSSEVDSGKLNNKVLNKEVWKNYDYHSFNCKEGYSVSENYAKTSFGIKENGLDSTSLSKTNNLESHLIGSFDPLATYNSKIKDFANNRMSFNDGYCNILMEKKSEKAEKYKHNRKIKSDREKRKRDRSRDREEGRSSSKKLKIKLKHDDKAVVRPLRIKSDERNSGGLKLTLKKQEGSSGYYRVGDERGREYRVEQNEDEDEIDSMVPILQKNQSNQSPDDSSESGRQLKSVSVVLEDCLQVECKNRKEVEDQKSYRKSKRPKLHHHAARETFDADRHGERENSVSWSSKFVDAVPTVEKFIDKSRQVDRFVDRPRQPNHNSGFFYQSHPYALDSSLSPKQQKIIHQSSRSSQRLT